MTEPVPSSSELMASRFLDVLEQNILPLTKESVAAGNKVFGAAILKKSDLSLVVANTNHELECPMWHGEVNTLKTFYELKLGIPTKELIFLSTHEPCSMCMSAITWAGFDNFYSYFSHEDSRDAFAIPYDLQILKEVFGLEPGAYRRQNMFWNSYFVKDLVNDVSEPQRAVLLAQASRIDNEYKRLSHTYQRVKDGNAIPLR